MSEKGTDAWVYVAVPVEGNENQKDENLLVDDSIEDDIMHKKVEKEPVINDKMLYWILIGMMLGTFVLTTLVGSIAFGTSEPPLASHTSHPDGIEPPVVQKISLQKKNNQVQMFPKQWVAELVKHQSTPSEETSSSVETPVEDSEIKSRRTLKEDAVNEVEYKQGVAMLTPSTIDVFLTQYEMTYVYFRVNHQCPECRKLAPVMKAFANQVEDLSVGVGFVDCDKYGLLCASLELDTFPTLRFYFQDDPSLEHRSVVHLSPYLRISDEDRVKSLVNLSKRMIAQNNLESMEDTIVEQRDLRLVA